MPKTHKATVIVAPREGGHEGWYSGGRFWPAGQHENVELTEDVINGLARRPGVVVLVGGKAVKPSEKTGPATQQEAVTSDELEALNEYRREKLRAAAQLEKQESAGLEFTGEKRGAAVERALNSATGGAAALGSADAPLMDADILKGAPPPENPMANVKPVEPPPSKKR